MKETLELDSLSLLDLIAVVERETGIKLKGAEVSHLLTFGDLYSFLEQQCS
jgi:acyl carrier protein